MITDPRRLLWARRLRAIREQQRLYDAVRDRAEIEALQLRQFNASWARALRASRFHAEWAREHGLPSALLALSELEDFPVLGKGDLLDRQTEIQQIDGWSGERFHTTGGSTGTPLRLPAEESEAVHRYATAYAARGWWGIKPLDPYVHIWGHAHLQGGRLGRVRRGVQDRVAGAVRLNAYDRSPEGLTEQARVIAARRPRYVIGYTSSLCKVAHAARSLGLDPSDFPGMEAAIVTSESVHDADVDVIESTFGCPVVIEYGSAESGVISYSRERTWHQQVMWASCILTTGPQGEVRLTSLDPRAFPLVMYDLGDVIVGADSTTSVLSFERVLGRSQDVVRLAGERGSHEVRPGLLVSIVRQLPEVTSVQMRQVGHGDVQVLYVATEPLPAHEVRDLLLGALRREYPTVLQGSVLAEQVDEPVVSRSGKLSPVVS